MKIRLLVACREEYRSEAHSAALTRVAGDQIAPTATKLDAVTRMATRQLPDVALLEFMADQEERLWSIVHRLALVCPATRVLMLCELCTDRMVASFIAHDVCGSVAAHSDPSLWAKAVGTVHRGESWFARSPVLQALRLQLAAHQREQLTSTDEERRLTAREREILSLIGSGMSNKEIGRVLNISDQTVKTHLHHIYVKLHQSGRYKAFAAIPAALAPHSWSSAARSPPC